MAATREYQRKAEEVLTAAEELFLRHGYTDTTMQVVAAHAGVAKATVYSNFPTKDALFEAVVSRRAEVNPIGAEHIDLESHDTRATLVELATCFLSAIYSREHLELLRTVVADARRFPHLGALVVEGAGLQTRTRIREYFARLIARSELQINDLDMAVEYFLAIIKADRHVKLLLNQDVDTTPETIRTIAEGAVDIFLNGSRPRG
ncbi:TetR/AcrR family transcriptional repressor of mexJK operon [Catenulispora sp. GAS73]|uniref:TetR/AcrR family transcriptional regulator n=1 Tax=Catenulispora sp. GAS73 TaxID=3156269 RepID=UPI0035192F46